MNIEKNIQKGNFNKIITYIFLLLFLVIFIYSGIKIIKYNLESKQNEKIIEYLSDLVTVEQIQTETDNEIETETNKNIEEKYVINFEELKKRNNDTVGFLKVKGTDIEYIVVKGKNNDYYLKHNFEKQYNAGGWIFADYHNRFDGTDKNIVIYGHNMRNGTMFCSLKNILNKEWQNNEDNRKIIFVTENENYIYEVFSVYQIKDEFYYIKTDFKYGEFNKFVKTIKERSVYDFGVEINNNDSVLTLSTCANDNRYRVVLHAKKIKQ